MRRRQQQQQQVNNGTKSPSTPQQPAIGHRLIGFMRKFENSLETSSSKLRVVSRYLTDKSSEIKEVIMANTSQHDLKGKLKSISSYNLGVGVGVGTPGAYINTLVKSNTNVTELVSSAGGGGSDKAANAASTNNNRRLTPGDASIASSQTSLRSSHADTLASYLASADLETVLSDDSLAHLTLKWWSALEEKSNVANETLLVDVQMTSCN